MCSAVSLFRNTRFKIFCSVVSIDSYTIHYICSPLAHWKFLSLFLLNSNFFLDHLCCIWFNHNWIAFGWIVSKTQHSNSLKQLAWYHCTHQMNSHREYIWNQCNAGAECFESIYVVLYLFVDYKDPCTRFNIWLHLCCCCHCLCCCFSIGCLPFIACLLVDCTVETHDSRHLAHTNLYTRFQWKLMRIKWALMEPNINMHRSKHDHRTAHMYYELMPCQQPAIGSPFSLLALRKLCLLCECASALKLGF